MIKIDPQKETIIIEGSGENNVIPFHSPQAFQIISDLWLRVGWDNKYVYSFSWLGRPIIQLPEDMIRIQEIVYQVKPTVIIETGVAHGGSLIYYASLLQSMKISEPRIIGVDIEIRKHNRDAIEQHELSSLIYLIESNAIDPAILSTIQSFLNPDDIVMVILDSNHSKDHVLKELNLYSQFVSKGSYIVVTDGIMKDLNNAPRTEKDWEWNNPYSALQDFIKDNDNFKVKEPLFPFNEGNISFRVTYWPSAFLQKVT